MDVISNRLDSSPCKSYGCQVGKCVHLSGIFIGAMSFIEVAKATALRIRELGGKRLDQDH
jgi:hypothetical protein